MCSTVGSAVPWGFQCHGGYHAACGRYLEYRGDVQYLGNIMINVGDILSTMGDIMSTVGVILSTIGDTQYCGVTMMHVGDIISTVGENLLLFEYPYCTEHPMVLVLSFAYIR